MGKDGRPEALSEEEMIENYRPDPASVMQEHVRNYLLFEEAHEFFGSDADPQFEDESVVEPIDAVIMDADESMALL